MRQAVLLLLCGLAQASPCYTTVDAATHGGAQGIVPLGVTSGFRVEARRWDALLGREWATVARCEAPERPAVTVAVTGERPVSALPGTASATGRPVVVAGQAVRVVYHDDRVQVMLAGVAEGSGNVGDRVPVRVVRGSGEDGAGAEQRLVATVRGPQVLELVTGIEGRL